MTRFLQALALRERALLPVLQPRLPGPFERREPLVEPGGGEPPAYAQPASPEPAIEAVPGLVVNEPAPLHAVERRTRPAVHDAPAVADALPQASPLRRIVAASLPALRSGSERRAAPHPESALPPAERMEGGHAERRLEPPVQRVAAAPAAQAAAPSGGHRSERRPDPAQLDTPAPASSATADVAPQPRNAPSAARLRQAKPPLAPRAAQARPADERRIERPVERPVERLIERLIERPTPARPVQGSLAEAEPRYRLTPAIVQQAQAWPAAADDHAAARPAGPTVHVSIGRVEIRAAAVPAAAPGPASRGKPPARAPALSLNDYLQQRGGAKRSGGGTGSAR